MGDEIIKKLKILLSHWMEHNQEHAAEYEKWASLAREARLEEVALILQAAIEEIEKTNAKLTQVAEVIAQRIGE